MDDSPLSNLADILPLVEATPIMAYWLLLAAVCVLLLLGFRMWHGYGHPLARLGRRLQHGVITPRDAAHALARMPLRDTGLRLRVDFLRFRRQAPDVDELAGLIQQARRG